MPATSVADPLDAFLARFRPHCGRPNELLLPRAALDGLPPLYSQESARDPLCRVKVFTPDASWTWYAIEAAIERDADQTTVVDVRLFGYVVGPCPELGYFSLAGLGATRGRLGLPVERDFWWTPRPLSAVRAEGESAASA